MKTAWALVVVVCALAASGCKDKEAYETQCPIAAKLGAGSQKITTPANTAEQTAQLALIKTTLTPWYQEKGDVQLPDVMKRADAIADALNERSALLSMTYAHPETATPDARQKLDANQAKYLSAVSALTNFCAEQTK